MNTTDAFSAELGITDSLYASNVYLGFEIGIKDHFSNVTIIIDKFHVINHVNEAMDNVRKIK